MGLQLKRAYDQPESADGFRVLVDRLWPRGVTKDKAKIDLWLKDIAPSTELRQWFQHDPAKWTAFRTRYFAELDRAPEAVAVLREHLGKGRVTLVYGAKDTAHNQAVALADYLARRAG